MFARFKYLVITKLTIATCLLGVCYEASDVMLLVSLPFQQAHLLPLRNP
jgi:hypothetical protein